MRFRSLLVSLVFVAGCSSGPLVRDAPDAIGSADFPNHSVATVIARLDGAEAPDAYRSGARVEITRGDRTDNASLTLHARGDSVSAAVRGPFGIEVGRALATADSVYLYDGLKGRVLFGPTYAAAPYVPGFDAPSGDALRGAILGDAPLLPPDAAILPVADGGLDDGPAYRLTYPEPDGTLSVWTVDAGLWRVMRYEARGPGGEVLLRQTFGAFDTVQERVVPRRIVLERPVDGLAIEIEHRDLRIGGDVSPSFRVPASAPRTRFD